MNLEKIENRTKIENQTEYEIEQEGSNVVKTKKKKIYEYYRCDFCGEKIILTEKYDERTGGIVKIPISLTKIISLA